MSRMQGLGKRTAPVVHLVAARLREFYREPEAIFWGYAFPILMVISLGIAFRQQPVPPVRVGVVAARRPADLPASEWLELQVAPRDQSLKNLATGKVDAVLVMPEEGGPPQLIFDPTRSASVLARQRVYDWLQRQAGRRDPVAVVFQEVTGPGSRYIDFLVPGLVGMSLMGGGLWGAGFLVVDMRLRQLLKRLVATPMRKSDFLLSIILARVILTIPEVALIWCFASWFFEVRMQGSWLAFSGMVFLGTLMFSAAGLLLACRARTLEGISGLLNLFMVPMWIGSGIFFPVERFPEKLQPFLYLLPLTPLNHALRAIALEGAGWGELGRDVAWIAAWTVLSFAVALKCFRWH